MSAFFVGKYTYANGDAIWYNKNGKRHRLDGPAIIWNDGTKFWYIDGAKLPCKTDEEFKRYIEKLIVLL